MRNTGGPARFRMLQQLSCPGFVGRRGFNAKKYNICNHPGIPSSIPTNLCVTKYSTIQQERQAVLLTLLHFIVEEAGHINSSNPISGLGRSSGITNDSVANQPMPATEMYDSGDSSPVVVCRNKISASDYIDQDGSMDLDRIAHKTHPGALLLQKLGHGLSGSLSKLHPGGHNHNSSSQNLNNHTTFNTMVPPAMATFPFQQATAGLGGAAAVPMPEPLNTAGSRMSWSSPQPPMGPSVSPHIQPRPAGVTAPMMHMAQAQTKPLPIARGTQQMGSGDSWLSFGADAGTQSPQSLPRSFPGSGLSLNTLDEGFQRLITSPRMAGAHAAYCSAGGSAQQMMDLPQAQLTDPWETSGIDDSYYQTNPGRPPYSFASLICKAIIANAKQNPNSQGASLKVHIHSHCLCISRFCCPARSV